MLAFGAAGCDQPTNNPSDPGKTPEKSSDWDGTASATTGADITKAIKDGYERIKISGDFSGETVNITSDDDAASHDIIVVSKNASFTPKVLAIGENFSLTVMKADAEGENYVNILGAALNVLRSETPDLPKILAVRAQEYRINGKIALSPYVALDLYAAEKVTIATTAKIQIAPAAYLVVNAEASTALTHDIDALDDTVTVEGVAKTAGSGGDDVITFAEHPVDVTGSAIAAAVSEITPTSAIVDYFTSPTDRSIFHLNSDGAYGSGGSITVSSAKTLDLNGHTLTVAGLAVDAEKTFTVRDSASVPNGKLENTGAGTINGTLAVADGATLAFGGSATLVGSGTVNVSAKGTTRNANSGADFWGSGTASMVFASGAKAYESEAFYIGADSDDVYFKLASGTITLKKNTITLAGNATVAKSAPIQGGDTVKIENGSTLTVAANQTLALGGTLDVAASGTVRIDGTITGGTITRAEGSKFVFSSTANTSVADAYINGSSGATYTVGANALFTEIAGTSDSNKRGWKHEISGGTVTLNKRATYGSSDDCSELTVKTGGALVNAATGADKILAIRTAGKLTVENDATLTVNANSTLRLDVDSAAVNLAGTLNVLSSGTVSVRGTVTIDGSLANAGTVALAATAVVNVNGTLSGAGAITEVQNAKIIYSHTANQTLTGAYINGTNSTWTVGTGAFFTEIAGTTNGSKRDWKHEISGTGTVTLNKRATYGSSDDCSELTVKSGGTLVVAAVLTDEGTPQILAIRTAGKLTVESGAKLTVNASSKLQLNQDSTATTLAGTLNNSGTVTVNGTVTKTGSYTGNGTANGTNATQLTGSQT